MLCTSGFIDNVTFGSSGRMAIRGRLTLDLLPLAGLRSRGGVWCMNIII